jgi:hypothetical protein
MRANTVHDSAIGGMETVANNSSWKQLTNYMDQNASWETSSSSQVKNLLHSGKADDWLLYSQGVTTCPCVSGQSNPETVCQVIPVLKLCVRSVQSWNCVSGQSSPETVCQVSPVLKRLKLVFYFNTCSMHLLLFCTKTSRCTIIAQINYHTPTCFDTFVLSSGSLLVPCWVAQVC